METGGYDGEMEVSLGREIGENWTGDAAVVMRMRRFDVSDTYQPKKKGGA